MYINSIIRINYACFSYVYLYWYLAALLRGHSFVTKNKSKILVQVILKVQRSFNRLTTSIQPCKTQIAPNNAEVGNMLTIQVALGIGWKVNRQCCFYQVKWHSLFAVVCKYSATFCCSFVARPNKTLARIEKLYSVSVNRSSCNFARLKYFSQIYIQKESYRIST